MKPLFGLVFRVAIFVLVVLFWGWAYRQQFPAATSALIVLGGILLVFPVVWLGRKMLDRSPTVARAARMNAFVHYSLLVLLGTAILEAVKTHQAWTGWTLPVAPEIGYVLVLVTGFATLLTVANLALKGLGAPFAVALSRRLAVDWLYAWTRNPMVLGTLACLLSLGIWYRSTLFVLWVLALVTPAWLAFVKLYEERELEIRFGAPYLEYKARTPLLFPRRPKS